MTTLFPSEIVDLAGRVVATLRAKRLTLTTAESCTGGLIAGAITEIAGASDVLGRGLVTYANEAKVALLGVPKDVLAVEGAVSEAVARAMAEGALARSDADVAIAVTGIAGPGGGTTEKPVGLVHFGCARRGAETLHYREVFPGDRTAIRLATVRTALELVLRRIS
ncbi:MAG: CinA family protein [Gemmatimonas sp.]